MFALGIVTFLLFGLAGLAMIPLGLPGTFIIVAGSGLAGLITAWELISVSWVFIFLGFAALGEILDLGVSALGVKSLGASGKSMTGALIGSIAGAIVGTPVPVVGNVIGAFVGGFLGALLVEMAVSEDIGQALKSGLGAFLGKVFGSLLKVTIGSMMIVKVLMNAF
ncbi:DUF456 domain-containing protein [Candidatus Bipolaricaulota bacterium]|nr:DUF456 domain-containing protein [Candidatus Bipolaricaulota bacterium]